MVALSAEPTYFIFSSFDYDNLILQHLAGLAARRESPQYSLVKQ
jgi:hypothetical protein